MRNIILTSFLLASSSLFAATPSCKQTHAVIDMGSTNTKVKVAKVDTCLKKITKVLFYKNYPIEYKNSADLSLEMNISIEMMQKGVDTLNLVKKEISKFRANKLKVYASSAFWGFQNKDDLLNAIKNLAGLSVQVLEQSDEAQMGLASIKANTKTDPDKIIVWDIGGTTMQMVTEASGERESKIETYSGQLGSESFKNNIIKRVKQNNTFKVTTPNPMGLEDILAAKDIAHSEARMMVPQYLQEKISRGGVVLYGIGMVHTSGIQGYLSGKKSYTLGELELIIHQSMLRSDEQIGGKYASNKVTNAILIGAFMEALGIHTVTPMAVDLTDGLLMNGMSI